MVSRYLLSLPSGIHVTLRSFRMFKSPTEVTVLPSFFPPLPNFHRIRSCFTYSFTCAVICLSFWAEVHYNSIYPEGGKWKEAFSFYIHLLGKQEEKWNDITGINNCFVFIFRTSSAKLKEKEEMVEFLKPGIHICEESHFSVEEASVLMCSILCLSPLQHLHWNLMLFCLGSFVHITHSLI